MQLKHRVTKEDFSLLRKDGEWLNTTIVDNLLYHIYTDYYKKNLNNEVKHIIIMAQDSRILFSKYKTTGKVFLNIFNKYFLNNDQKSLRMCYYLPFNLDGLLKQDDAEVGDYVELKHWFLVKIEVCLIYCKLTINIYDSMNNEEHGILNSLCGWLQNLCLQILKSNDLGNIYRKNSLLIKYHPLDIQMDSHSCADFMILFILYYVGGLGILPENEIPLESQDNRKILSEYIIKKKFRKQLCLYLEEKNTTK